MSRGYRPPEPGGTREGVDRADGAENRRVPDSPTGAADRLSTGQSEAPAAFVCEDDVRVALRAGRKVMIGDKTIITPAARDLGEENKVFIQAGWPR
jgi:hypothetical protein